MQQRQAAGLLLTIFVVLGILGILSAIAIPHVNQMIYKTKAEARETEFLKIQTAVIEMLRESACGMLEPIGPTADISQVRTRDAEPLVLSDYLSGIKDNCLASGCQYSFTSDGTVLQVVYLAKHS